MRKILFAVFILLVLAQPVSAKEYSTESISKEAEKYITEDASAFWRDLHTVVEDALKQLRPDIAEGAKTCLTVICVTLLGSALTMFSSESKFAVRLVLTICVGLLMLSSGNSLIGLGKETITEIGEYGKMILPIMTAALASQGSVNSSAVLYAGTAFFSSLLNITVSKLLIPLLYIFLSVCIANNALADETLKRIRELLKWSLTWSLKMILYLFGGYMSISGVISGSVDASVLKATKLAISGAVPVVGNILSDASETILLSAGLTKNSIGVYGLLMLISLLIEPFLKIGLHYVMTKGTAIVCSAFASKGISDLIDDFSSIMGYILAMTSVSCVLLMVGIVCMMRGVR